MFAFKKNIKTHLGQLASPPVPHNFLTVSAIARHGVAYYGTALTWFDAAAAANAGRRRVSSTHRPRNLQLRVRFQHFVVNGNVWQQRQTVLPSSSARPRCVCWSR